jgi:hypothetical protein
MMGDHAILWTVGLTIEANLSEKKALVGAKQ